jgi:hypothetical protein
VQVVKVRYAGVVRRVRLVDEQGRAIEATSETCPAGERRSRIYTRVSDDAVLSDYVHALKGERAQVIERFGPAGKS